jgi:exoribonuclease-2
MRGSLVEARPPPREGNHLADCSIYRDGNSNACIGAQSQYDRDVPPPNDKSVEILRKIARRVMRERNLLPEFSSDSVRQAEAISGPAASVGTTAADLRDRLWASIDNDDSRDLDQLSVSAPADGGAVRLLLAIADVDAVVERGSAIDRDAEQNTTSVYTVAQIFPMLPQKLSTNLTSLVQDEDRLALIIDMTIAADGKVTASDLYRGLVRNRAKLAYNSVAAWLDGRSAMPPPVAAVPGLDEQLRTQDRVAALLKRVRHAQGALSLQTLEPRAVFVGDSLQDLRPEEGNRAKELIEDFMIAGNGATVRFLAAKRMPSLRRVLRTPQSWDRIVGVAREFGEQLPPQPDARALNQFLMKRREADPARFPDVSLTVVKLLGRGEYVLERPGEEAEGHFGLAISDYTHSTAPNRRFPDLISQRLVKCALNGGALPYTESELAALAAHCTMQEDNAAKVERFVRKSAAALLLSGREGQRFDAIVTGAAPKGTWVRISNPTTEGKVVKGFAGMEVGARVRVELVRTDIERGFIDFAGLK